MLRYVLLALLQDGEPAHGYALMKAYRERSGVPLSIGNIYRELQRLAAESLIVTAANPDGADPRRTPYAITETGRAVLSEWMDTPMQRTTRGGLDEISYRLAILGDMRPEVAAERLESLDADLWTQAKAIERERAEASRREGSGRAFPIRAMLLTHRAMQLAADIELVGQARERVAERRAQPARKKSGTDLVSVSHSSTRSVRRKTRGDSDET